MDSFANENLSVQIDERGLAVAVIDMPGRPFNVFSESMMASLAELIGKLREALLAGEGPKALVITSGKPAFVAGADLVMIEDFGKMRFGHSFEEKKARYSYLGRLFRELELLQLPVVAAVNGLALGGGLELAMACHRRVAVNVASPMLGLPEIKLGLLPGAGGTQRLPRLVGIDAAAKILLGGDPVVPADALAMGLVDQLAEPEELLDVAAEMALSMSREADTPAWDAAGFALPAEDLALLQSEQSNEQLMALGGWSLPSADCYPAVDAIIACMRQGNPLGFDEGCEAEWNIFVDLMSHTISSSMVATGFLSKTAAPRMAAARLPEKGLARIESIQWRSASVPPKGLSKFTLDEQSGLTVGDADQDVQIALVDAAMAAEDADQPSLLLRRKGSDVAELCIRDRASAPLSQLNSLCRALRVTPVLNEAASPFCAALKTAFLDACAQRGVDAQRWVEMASAIDSKIATVPDGRATGGTGGQGSSYIDGVDLLLHMSLTLCPSLQGEQALAERAAMLDLIAVSVFGFPAWTGGPFSLLAMAQYREIPGYTVVGEIGNGIDALPWQIKGAAGYLFELKQAEIAS